MKLYWIAINGSSCACSSIPFVRPTVTPTPEVLIGFPNVEEAKDAQKLCLKAPIGQVKASMKLWMTQADIRIIRPSKPDPPTSGVTLWLES